MCEIVLNSLAHNFCVTQVTVINISVERLIASLSLWYIMKEVVTAYIFFIQQPHR
jgi:hypothetical protein